MRDSFTILATLILAGCGSPADPPLDSGDIAPGQTVALTMPTHGVVAMLCHPHPSMLHEVAIIAGGPKHVHVHILDGASLEDYRFEPRNLTVGPGARVEYHNHGTTTHTATQEEAHGEH